jgi:glycosyltransferase involved in cell wall biosynthesis
MEQSPQIWFNLSCSHAWKRAPVGVIRVEQSIYNELHRLYGCERIKPCIWKDGAFRSIDNKTNDTPPPGSILITMGLDWDQPYKNLLFELRKKHSLTVIVCCYDLIPVLFPQYCVGDVAAYFKEYFAEVTWGASGVLCISSNSEKDYLELCSASGWPIPQTRVMPLGDNLPTDSGEISKDVERLCSQPLILFVSTIERRKNHQCLVQAYHLLRRTKPELSLPKLVFVGMLGWGTGDILKDIELDPLTKDYIVVLHHVSDSELSLLYKSAMLCAYPSFYEGWGLPLGEALAMGKPVFSSDAGSLPEVGGDLVRYLSPFNPVAWADAIADTLENPGLLQAQATRVKSEYKAREWKDAAAVVFKFAEDCHAHDNAVRFPIEINPGYDCSTIVGKHKGPYIMNSDITSGFLMFGPFLDIPPGRYRVAITGCKGATEDGDVIFQVCEGDRSVPNIILSGYTNKEAIENSLLWISEIFIYEQPIKFMQVRCLINVSREILIKKISLEKINE